MRVQRWVMAVAVLALVEAGCSTAEKKITAADIAGTVVLETYRVDLGWNYLLAGMYIDGDGGVFSYELRGTPWYPERLKSGEMSERDLLTKHKNAQRIGTVDITQLVLMAQMIAGAEKGRITRAHPALEGNGTRDVAYRLDKNSKTYKEIILTGTGDLAATNSSGDARALIDYIREVEAAVGYR